MPRSPALVEVVWWDAKTYLEEMDLDGVKARARLATRHTVGWLVFRDAERCIVAGTYDPPEGFADVTVIPNGWVQRIKRKRNQTR